MFPAATVPCNIYQILNIIYQYTCPGTQCHGHLMNFTISQLLLQGCLKDTFLSQVPVSANNLTTKLQGYITLPEVKWTKQRKEDSIKID